ncbi:unnamed protein product [Chironomus riparius]|uniref:Homeobox domain-containing protein n=1 Tax=Chironomus riparius TaxID=315576 RepID=A0A9N9RZQ1_9DIPT|nr:unnamed protein product [Chironomus riparius]
MMPSATSLNHQTLKPKIGFSIESIVGDRVKGDGDYCDDSDDGQEKMEKFSKSDDTLSHEYSQLLKRARCGSPENLDKSIRRLSSSNNNNNNNCNVNNNISDNKNENQQGPQSQSSLPATQIPSTVMSSGQKGQPLIVPEIPAGLIRPIVSHNTQLPAHYPDVTTGHPHLLAQFHAAAALVQSGYNGPMPQHLPPHLHNPNIQRESYPLYPWLLNRHGRIFPHRFPGTFPDFLLQPFRKPKRVRTAFSPSQLLKLEHAFEGNHYVVGAERKTLAQQLSLTETQVKVWFQNRRTKFKRMQQEDCDSKSGNKSNGSPKNFDDDENDDDEMIDIGDECPSDDEMLDNCA